MARIASLATVSIASLLVGMRLSPQDPEKMKAAVAERYDAVQLIMKRAAEARDHALSLPWERAAELETRVLWSRRFAEAAVEAKAMSGRDAYGKHLELLEREMVMTKGLVDAGRCSEVDVAIVRFHIAEVKLLLERAK